MKFNIILGCAFALAGIAVAVPGPRCYNMADPDRGLGDWCQCKGGACYKPDPKTICHPPSDHKIKCPEDSEI